MDLSQPGFSERAHTRTGTWTSCHITPWRTRWQWPRLCSTVQKGSAPNLLETEKDHFAKKLKTTGIPEVLFSNTGHLQSSHHQNRTHPQPQQHSPTYVRMPLVREESEDLGSSQDSDLLPATLNPPADTGQVTGPNTLTTTSRCHLPNSLWHLLTGTLNNEHSVEHRMKKHKS